jgi:FAD/FMN-containing dehydrogenase
VANGVAFSLATGSSGCVGFPGAGLGGGHGRYEGQYGMMVDNFITLNVVLADGSTIQVSQKSHDDLFWAMKGAGHNFGVVTSLELAIHPRGSDTWHYHNYVWSQDQLEAVFEALNTFHGNGTTPVLMGVNFGQFSIDPSMSATDVRNQLSLPLPQTVEIDILTSLYM